MAWITCWFHRHDKDVPPVLTEVWVLVILLVQIIALFLFDTSDFALVFVGIYGLFDILIATIRDLFVGPQLAEPKDGYLHISVKDSLRWLILAILNVLQMVLCFAILFLYSGLQFNPSISDPVTALYQSALTFTTLGYGEITPVSNIAKWIVIFELAFFILFIGLKFPVAISMFRVKQRTA
jgi:hypothetical protein